MPLSARVRGVKPPETGIPGEIVLRALRQHAAVICTHASRMEDPATASEAFHQIRSSCKKIRAIVRLARRVISPKDLRGVLATVRSLKDAVAHARDRDVLLLRIQELTRGKSAKLPRPNRPPPSSEKVQRMAEQLQNHVDRFSLEELQIHHVLLEIIKSYGRSSARYRACRRKARDHRLHEWRKQVKIFQFQCGLFNSWNLLGIMSLRAALLSRMLGDHHDFAVTGQQLHRFKKHRKRLAKTIRKRKAQLSEEAFHVGRHLFCLTPREFAAGLAGHSSNPAPRPPQKPSSKSKKAPEV